MFKRVNLMMLSYPILHFVIALSEETKPCKLI